MHILKAHALTALVAASAFVVVGCSAGIDGETPAVSALAPSLVCVEQLTTSVTISGDKFSPLPINSATSTPQLALPAITLRRTADLTGATVSEASVPIPDDPANPSASRVRWNSTQTMEFDVFPALGLQPGLFDVTVTNRNGNTVTLPNALAGVEGPTITKVIPDLACDEQGARMIAIVGTSFVTVGTTAPSVMIGTMAFTPTASECTAIPNSPTAAAVCTTLTVTIPQNTFQPGVYDVKVTNPAPAGCTTSATAQVTLAVVPAPVITSFAPSILCGVAGDHTFTIHGTGFVKIGTTLPSVTVRGVAYPAVSAGNCTPIAGTISGAESCTFLTVVVPQAGMVVGANSVSVANPDPPGCTSNTRDLSLSDGPLVVFVNPRSVWNGIDTPVTVYIAGATLPISSVQIVQTGSMNVPTSLSFTPAPGHPDRPNAVVPMGTPVGTYDVIVQDGSGCPSVLTAGLRVTNDTSKLTLTGISPTFGWTSEVTSVAISALPVVGFGPLPTVYLTKPGLTTPVVLSSVARISATSLTADVRSGLAPGLYTVVVVNQDGTVGVLPNSFTVIANPPPKVVSITLNPVPNTSTTQAITITGKNFRAPVPMVPSVVLNCLDPLNAKVPSPTGLQTATVTAFTATTACNAAATCTISATFNATLYPTGANCIVEVTNADDGSKTQFSSLVVVTPTQNLTDFTVATAVMSTARRGLAAVAGEASIQSRFLYAIAGDNGTTAQSSVETLGVDIFGLPGTTFFDQRYSLNTARTGIGAVLIKGNNSPEGSPASGFMYAVGGTSTPGLASGALATVERAAILDQSFHPDNLNVDLALSTTDGVPGGIYYYRVAAVMPASDPFNPNGETLPSTSFGLSLPTLVGRALRVTLTWDGVPNAIGYRIYRTVANALAGSDGLIATVTAPTLTFTDVGTTAPNLASTPLPLGSTGTWTTVATMGTARWAPGVTFAIDPGNPKIAYLYVFGGRNATGVLSSYELLSLALNTNGSQTPAVAFTNGVLSMATARYRLGAYVCTPADTTKMGTNTYVWAGDGASATNTMVTTFEGGQVTAATGQLLGQPLATTLTSAITTSPGSAGYGAFGAGDYLYAFGGTGGIPSKITYSLDHTATPPTLANFGGFAPGMKTARVDVGAAKQSGYFYVLGGETPGGVITKTIEYVLY